MKNFISIPHLKNAAKSEALRPPTPPRLVISMSQNIGAPCEPLVKVGDRVLKGQKIGDTEKFVSAPIYTGLGGKVAAITDVMSPQGRRAKAVVIDVDDNAAEVTYTPPSVTTATEFLAAVRGCGAVGLGGAGFPTHVKLHFDSDITDNGTNPAITTLIVNGAECEPYIVSDNRAFLENTDRIVEGINHVVKWNKITQVIIAIESNKPDVIKLMSGRIPDINTNAYVLKLPSLYPQGAEKVIVYQATGKLIPQGKLPAHAGCVVINPSTLASIARYIATGQPICKRRVTVDGDCVAKPYNCFYYVGTPLSFVLAQTELKSDPRRVIMGGPMMGSAVRDLDIPVSKTTNAVLFLSGELPEPTPCIKCGRCIRACSMGLHPVKINNAYEAGDTDALKRLSLPSCLNCGACTYVCPAKRRVAETNQLAKGLITP